MRFKWMFLFVLLTLIMGIPQVFAQTEDNEHVNILEIPSHLADALGIPQFASELLVCSLFMLIILLPIAIFSKGNPMLTLIIGFVLLGFFIAVGWMPYWFLLIIGLIVASLWSAKIKGWIT